MTRDERQDAWASLRMVSEAIEELFGPSASLESEEASLLRGPEYHHRAAGIVQALQRAALSAALRKPASPVAATGPEKAVEDTWFTDRALPIMAMSGDVESDHVLKIHFRRRVTDADRQALVDALNASTALREHFLYGAGGVWDGKEPCGECYIQPGETCDICGASRPAALQEGTGK